MIIIGGEKAQAAGGKAHREVTIAEGEKAQAAGGKAENSRGRRSQWKKS